jgi:hypothetical protein
MQDSNNRFLHALESRAQDSLARNVAVNASSSSSSSSSSNSSAPPPSAVVSNDNRFAWRFRRFMAYDASLESCIKAGDLVRLFHMEEESFMVGHIVDDVSVCS